MLRESETIGSPLPNTDIAEIASLTYVNDGDDGITRKRVGKRFSYVLPSGAVLKDGQLKSRA